MVSRPRLADVRIHWGVPTSYRGRLNRNPFDPGQTPFNSMSMHRPASSARRFFAGFFAVIAGLVAAPSGIVAADTPPPANPAIDALVDFYLPPDFDRAKLSPDGLHVAMIARSGELYGVAVFGLATGRTVIVPGIKDRHAIQLWWLTNRRLLVQVLKPRENDFSHIALNLDGSDVVEAWRIASDRLAVLDPRPGPPDEVLVSDYSGVWSHHLRTNKRTVLQAALPVRISRWLQDATGEVRAAYGAAGEKIFLHWRPPGSRAWQSRASTSGEPGVHALGFDRDPRYLWVADGTRGDRSFVSRLDTLDGSIAPAAGLPDAVPGVFVTEGERHLPFALDYSQHGNVPCAPLRAEDADAFTSLRETLPHYAFDFLGRVPDSSLWVLNLWHSRVPGTLVLFDWKSRQLSLVGQSHGARLPESRLAAGEHIRVASPRGTVLTGMLWCPAGAGRAPLVLVAPRALQVPPVRDLYYADVQALVAQGFAVAEINQRGRSGFGSNHQRAIIADPAGSLREDYGAAVEALRADPRIDGARVAFFGEDLGAAFVLATVAGPSAFTAAVAIGPPSEVTRDSLYGPNFLWSSAQTYDLAGGWSESERLAAALTPKKNLPALQVPLLLVFRPGPSDYHSAAERSAAALAPLAKRAATPTRIIAPRAWPRDFRSLQDQARDRAETIAEVGAFLREHLGAGK